MYELSVILGTMRDSITRRYESGDPTPERQGFRDGATAVIDRLQDWLDQDNLSISREDRRKLNSSNALFLIRAFRRYGTRWFTASDVIESDPRINRDATQAKYWNLLEEAGTATGRGRTDGRWRVTEDGVRFIRGQLAVPEYRVTQGGHLLRLEGDMVTIAEVVGSRFDYREHMDDQRT